MRSRRKPTIVNIDLGNIQSLDEDKKKNLISFCTEYKDIHIGQFEQYEYITPENEKMFFSFNCSLVQKPQKLSSTVRQFYLFNSLIGKGDFGAVYTGLGTFKIDKDNISIKQTMRCDFIYVSPNCDAPMEAWFAESKSKTAYVMLNNSLFYADKKTFFPNIAFDFIDEISKKKSERIIERHLMPKCIYNIYTKQLSEEEIIDFSIHHQPSHKNFVIKTQKHHLLCLPQLATREADLARKTSHLSKTKGPTFAYENELSFIKFDKMPGETLTTIIEEDKITYVQRIELTLALFDAFEKQIKNCGIIHRDMKPDNVLVDIHSMTISFIDFGFAKSDGEIREEDVGNVKYTSPERCQNIFTDNKSDSYSLAKMVAELWQFTCNHLEGLPTYDKRIEARFRIEYSNAEFLNQGLIEDPDQILTDLQFILEKMCLCSHNPRWDLSQGKKALQQIPGIKKYIHEHKYIVDKKTQNKLTEIAGMKSFSLFSDTSLKVVQNWQANTQCQNSILKRGN